MNEIFTSVSCILTNADNGQAKIPLVKVDEIHYSGETKEVIAQMSAEEADGVTVVKVRGEWKVKEPYFGRQKYFSHQQGLLLELGKIESDSGFMAVYQHKDWWLRPAFFQKNSEIPERTQLLMWKKDGIYFAAVSVCGNMLRSDMKSGEKGLSLMVSSNCGGMPVMEDVVLSMAEGTDPYLCCERAVKRILQILDKTKMYRTNREYPEKFRYFGWCSWDAFYHKVSEQGILDKLEELKEKKVPVGWVLIDDGWLDADYEKQQLMGLDAQKSTFPVGLLGTVKKIKENYLVNHVGVWHAVMGYWNGVKEGSGAYGELKDHMDRLADGRCVPGAEEGKSFSFWNHWHNYLSNHCGIDFVKVDGQSAVSLFYGGLKTYGEASGGVQKGLGASAALHFQNHIINCMGMAPEDMWNRPSGAVIRSSDDFVPEVPHGFREHAVQNSYNSLLSGQFYWGDWDMFWSSHEENWQNSMLRAVSGGPVYTSDKVGETNPEYIMPLLLDHGLLLQCEENGMPTTDCLFEDPVNTLYPLKIFNRFRDCYMIAAFNISSKEECLSAELGTGDIPALIGKEWWVYAWKMQKLFSLSDDRKVCCSLEPNDGELFLLVPKKEKALVPLGLMDKYLSVAAIKTAKIEERRAQIILKQGGRFGFLCTEPKPAASVQGADLLLTSRDGLLYEANCSSQNETDVVVDIIW